MKEDIIEVLKMIRFRCGSDFTIERLDNGKFILDCRPTKHIFCAEDLNDLKKQLKTFVDFDVFSEQEEDIVPYYNSTVYKGENINSFLDEHLR